MLWVSDGFFIDQQSSGVRVCLGNDLGCFYLQLGIVGSAIDSMIQHADLDTVLDRRLKHSFPDYSSLMYQEHLTIGVSLAGDHMS